MMGKRSYIENAGVFGRFGAGYPKCASIGKGGDYTTDCFGK